MNRFDERFWVTVAAIGMAGLFDFAVCFFPIRIEKELMTVILTALNTNGFVVAVQFWLGSSKGSQDKDATIHELSKGP